MEKIAGVHNEGRREGLKPEADVGHGAADSRSRDSDKVAFQPKIRRNSNTIWVRLIEILEEYESLQLAGGE